MALSEARIHWGRPTPYPWEREALDLAYAGTPRRYARSWRSYAHRASRGAG